MAGPSGRCRIDAWDNPFHKTVPPLDNGLLIDAPARVGVVWRALAWGDAREPGSQVARKRRARTCHNGRWLCFARRVSGTFWNARRERIAAEPQRAPRRDERHGAKDAKEGTPRKVRMCRRIEGLRIEGRWCAAGTIFAHRKLGSAGFLGVFAGSFLYFSSEGGCAEMVLDAHRGWVWGCEVVGGCGRRAPGVFGSGAVWRQS